jgi:hypothetical protein
MVTCGADKELPVMYLLGERYIQSVAMATRQRKLVLIPADLPAHRGMIGSS